MPSKLWETTLEQVMSNPRRPESSSINPFTGKCVFISDSRITDDCSDNQKL